METICTDIVERLYSGHPDAKPFLDPEPPVEVQMSLKQSQTGGVKDLERASVHIQPAYADPALGYGAVGPQEDVSSSQSPVGTCSTLVRSQV